MIGAQRRLDAIAAKTKRLVEAARRLEECLAARALGIERRKEVRRSKELLRRLEREVRAERGVEMAVKRVQTEFRIAAAVGQTVVGIVGEATETVGSPVMRLFSAALGELGRPSPIGDIRIITPREGDVYVLNLSQQARDGESIEEVLADLKVRGCRATTWEDFASEIATRLRKLGGGNVAESLQRGPWFRHLPPSSTHK